MSEDEAPWDLFAVRCPQCGAGVGLPCLDTRGWATAVHTERRLLAAP